MLKTSTTRTYEDPAREPDAWSHPREAGAAEARAPWRRPSEEPAHRGGQAAETRNIYSREGSGRGSAPTGAGRANGEGSENFRELARSIERRRPHQGAVDEVPVRGRSRLDAARHGVGREERTEREWHRVREERPPAAGELTLAAHSPDVARAADKADIARLEEMLAHVLRRLSALEERCGERSSLIPPAEETLSDAEARWAARRARAATQRTHPAAPAEVATPLPRSGATPRRLWS